LLFVLQMHSFVRGDFAVSASHSASRVGAVSELLDGLKGLAVDIPSVSFSDGVCVLAMSATGKLWFQWLALPALTCAAMVLLAAIVMSGAVKRRLSHVRQWYRSHHVPDDGHGVVAPVADTWAYVPLEYDGDDRHGTGTEDPRSTSINSTPDLHDATTLPQRSRLMVALLVQWPHYFSAQVLVVLVRLVHCVPLPGRATDATYLFIDGSVRCEWRASRVALVTALGAGVLLLSLLPVLALTCCAKANSCVASADLRRDVKLGVRYGLWAAFRRTEKSRRTATCLARLLQRSHPWAVMLLQRGVLAALSAFSFLAPTIQALATAAVCVLFWVWISQAQPMRRRDDQNAVSRFQACLVVVATCSVARAVSNDLQRPLAWPAFVVIEVMGSVATMVVLTTTAGHFIAAFVRFVRTCCMHRS
jgi:hypothetical protein